MSLIVDRRELDFLLFELFDVERILEQPRFAAYDRGAVKQILDTAQTVAEASFLPYAAEADRDEPRFVDGKVTLPASTGAALRAYADAGFFALPFPEDIGGLQAPWFLHTAVMGIFACANTSVTNYAFLTIAAANLLNAFGTQTLKDRFLPPMLDGRWFGTMCLSEPQAGSSLADIRTTATAGADGLYRIRGSKMWISGGDHEISCNIVHMVLAKIPGGPPGSKGISLFLAPKRWVDEDGAPAGLNNIALAGLNHKLGQRGTTNCLLNFGESGDTLGYLIGEPHRGLEYMFHMMNEARIGVGHASVMAGLGGYLNSLNYARERTQGRPQGQKDPASPQAPIIEHTDIKRMLLAQKAAVEGAQALSILCATILDEMSTSDTGNEERAALLGLLTPVAKSWPSEHCLEANKWAIQILGGYGYTRDYPVERFYRDNRLNHIHEGTFGIQGADLVGRKIIGDRARALQALVSEIRQTIAANSDGALAEASTSLGEAVDALEIATAAILACDDRALALANATIFLDAFGHIVIGWLWLRQASTAMAKLSGADANEPDRAFYRGKLAACRYFFRYEMPLAKTRLMLCVSLDDTCSSAGEEVFGRA